MNFRQLYSIILLVIPFLVNESKGAELFITDKNRDVIFSEEKIASIVYKSLNEYYSSKQLGSFMEDGKTFFRLFAPSAVNVKLYVFNDVDDETGKSYNMNQDEDGVWESSIDLDLQGKFYGYRVFHKDDTIDIEEKPLCVDPYSKAVASFTTHNNPRKSIVYENNYEWEDDSWIQRDWRDLIIYEMHVRDLTAHPTSGAKHPGTYKGLAEKGINGGIDYIKRLGVNTVELLPAMEFGNCEIPFMDSLNGKFNTWNPYERNHWGYMTSNFFAPSSYYAMDWNEFKWNEWMGSDARQVNQFKDMVKAFHKEGIGVIMDVVYNHLSEYEIGNLKEIDKEYYFRLKDKGGFQAQSGCGNDLKTERPMMRRLIVESILYWMREYHIDGFRFDLGKLIDWETIEEIIREARKVNPNVVFVCEPWGGGYDPQGFSLREWGSWNDQIRNGIKGENPYNSLGWIFGEWYGNNNVNRIKSYVNGTLVKYKHGLFQKKEHSVNYLESHDGYTLGDFIRIGTKEVDPDKTVENVDKHVKLTLLQMKLNKLAALFLFTSQGITMINEGQEFARSKVIPKNVSVPDNHKGMIDHNSYEKDNETNYINFTHAEINGDLLDYYKGLIELRKTYSAFRHADADQLTFFDNVENEFALGYLINHRDQSFIVLMNADWESEEEFVLPDGEWKVLVNESSAGVNSISTISGKYNVPPISGVVLKLR